MKIKTHWDSVYSSKGEDDLSWFQSNPSTSLSLIQSLAAGKQSAIIDIGGGTSTLPSRLLDAGYINLAVLDISAVALEKSRRRLGERARRVEWIEASVTDFRASRPFDLWHDRAVFHFLTKPEERQAYVRALEGAVPAGRAIISTFAMNGPEKCSGLDVVRYDKAKISCELGGMFALKSSFEQVHLTPWGAEQPFIFFVFERLTKASGAERRPNA